MLLWLVLLCSGKTDEMPPLGPLDPKVWTYSTDPALGIFDAMILESSYHITSHSIHRTLVCRIFSEEGQDVADVFSSAGNFSNLQGRVTTHNGQETLFDEADLSQRKPLRNKYYDSEDPLLLPPGMTNDCVVEYHWDTPATSGFINDQDTIYYAAEKYYVLQKQIRLDHKLFDPSLKRYIIPKISYRKGVAPILFEERNEEDASIYTFRNIPASKHFPFGSPILDPTCAYFSMRFLPEWAKDLDDPEAFWKKAVEEFVVQKVLAPDVNNMAYRRLIKEWKPLLPQDPADALIHLGNLFRGHFHSTKYLTPEQRDEFDSLLIRESDPTKLLYYAVRTRYGSRSTLTSLFYQIARDCGIPILLVYPETLRDGIFHPANLGLHEIYWHMPIFAVKVGDGLVLTTPQRYAAPVETFSHLFARGMGLMVDPNQNFSHSFIRLPASQASEHGINSFYEQELTDDMQVSMKATLVFAGEPEYVLREKLISRNSVEAELVLDKLFSDWQLKERKWLNLQDTQRNIGLTLTASTVAEDFGTGIFEIAPFPHSLNLIETPRFWPEPRQQLLIAPFPFKLNATSSLKVPLGFVLRGVNQWKHTNSLGEVSFSAVQDGQLVKANRHILLAVGEANADKEPELKQLLQWISLSMDQNLAFSKE